MSRKLCFLGLIALFLAVGGCGGSSGASGGSGSGSSSTAGASGGGVLSGAGGASGGAGSGGSGAGGASGSASGGAGAAGSSGGAGASGSSGGAGAGKKSGGSAGGGSVNVRVPATFDLTADGHLNPRTVSAPAFLAVRVTISSRDQSAHRVLVATPTPHALAVPPGGRASILIPGQRAGQYRIQVDGHTAGALLIGGEVGP